MSLRRELDTLLGRDSQIAYDAPATVTHSSVLNAAVAKPERSDIGEEHGGQGRVGASRGGAGDEPGPAIGQPRWAGVR